ncbi:MAG: hypothetical protein J7L15_07740 [Clostridiales bacterium]|nr:hypothetical protein [Clostridiales bacterium]
MPEDKNIKHLNGKTMTASEYYYDCPADTWDLMLYPVALKDRYKKVQALYGKLYNTKKVTFDDEMRFFKVQNALNDTKQLLDERTLII